MTIFQPKKNVVQNVELERLLLVAIVVAWWLLTQFSVRFDKRVSEVLYVWGYVCRCCQEFSALWPKLDAIFDAGCLSVSTQNKTGSTVVDLSKTGVFTIIRDGW